MEHKIKTVLLNIAIPIICYILLDALLGYWLVFTQKNTLFTLSISGLAAVLFYNLIIHYDIKCFLLGFLFTFLVSISFIHTTNIYIYIRHLNFFILMGVLAFSISYLEKKKWYKDSKVWIISSWLFGFICVYLLMVVLNIYVYQSIHIDERFGLLFYAKQSIKIGGVLGLGIGLGNFIVQLLSKTNIIK